MKIIISILFFFLPTFVFAQNFFNGCFTIDGISNTYTKPSRKGKMPYLNKSGIIFKLDRFNKKSVLKKRIKHLYEDNPNELALQTEHLTRFRVAYIANYEDSILVIPTIVEGITITQEVLDSQGSWRPVEVKNAVIGCATGVFGQIELAKQEFIEIYIRKYCGEFYTKFRLKLATKEKILISEEFEGYINPKQYDLTTLGKLNYEVYRFVGSNLKTELKKK